MVNPNDGFGRMMVKNLEARGCPLLGLPGCPDADAQRARFQSAGWHPAAVLTMNEVYSQLPAAEVRKIEKLEIFDEMEEWRLINEHYCLGWAVRAPPDSILSSITL